MSWLPTGWRTVKRILSLGTVLVLILTFVITAAQARHTTTGVPPCFQQGFLWLQTNCQSRDLYLEVAKISVNENTGAAERSRVQAAALPVGASLGPTALRQLGSLADSTSDANAECVRTQLLGFISSNADFLRTTGSVSTAFDTTAKALKLAGPQGMAPGAGLEAGGALMMLSNGALTAQQLSDLILLATLC